MPIQNRLDVTEELDRKVCAVDSPLFRAVIGESPTVIDDRVNELNKETLSQLKAPLDQEIHLRATRPHQHARNQ